MNIGDDRYRNGVNMKFPEGPAEGGYTPSGGYSPEPTTSNHGEEPQQQEHRVAKMNDYLSQALVAGFAILGIMFILAFLWVLINGMRVYNPCFFPVDDRCRYVTYRPDGHEL
ncbi:hypothetical protein F4805DRAFT_452927 [Annulohypoxylon moriforme]|nr:hypothetical protein F4805DRAFT_452927 [Annulohypoxylon moriforme]